MEMSKTVDEYILKNPEWQEELIHLRKLMNSTELKETVKWGMPTYTINNKNVAGLGAFKSYVGIWFFQGVFLSDKHKRLINAQEGTTKGMRQWRFESFEEIDDKLIIQYTEEAIANQKAGKEIKLEKKPLVIPAELQHALNEDGILNQNFQDMSLSCRREYTEYIAEAKRDETKQKRLEKIIPMILNQVGLNDKYK